MKEQNNILTMADFSLNVLSVSTYMVFVCTEHELHMQSCTDHGNTRGSVCNSRTVL